MTIQTQEPNMASASVDAFIDGLRISDVTVHEKCIAALCAIGPRVIPVLNAAANSGLSAAHRRRVLEAIELIEDAGNGVDASGRDIWRALLDCLRVDDVRLNEIATDAISLMPGELVAELVAEATYHRRKTGYSRRLMIAASRLGLRRRDDQT